MAAMSEECGAEDLKNWRLVSTTWKAGVDFIINPAKIDLSIVEKTSKRRHFITTLKLPLCPSDLRWFQEKENLFGDCLRLKIRNFVVYNQSFETIIAENEQGAVTLKQMLNSVRHLEIAVEDQVSDSEDEEDFENEDSDDANSEDEDAEDEDAEGGDAEDNSSEDGDSGDSDGEEELRHFRTREEMVEQLLRPFMKHMSTVRRLELLPGEDTVDAKTYPSRFDRHVKRLESVFAEATKAVQSLPNLEKLEELYLPEIKRDFESENPPGNAIVAACQSNLIVLHYGRIQCATMKDSPFYFPKLKEAYYLAAAIPSRMPVLTTWKTYTFKMDDWLVLADSSHQLEFLNYLHVTNDAIHAPRSLHPSPPKFPSMFGSDRVKTLVVSSHCHWDINAIASLFPSAELKFFKIGDNRCPDCQEALKCLTTRITSQQVKDDNLDKNDHVEDYAAEDEAEIRGVMIDKNTLSKILRTSSERIFRLPHLGRVFSIDRTNLFYDMACIASVVSGPVLTSRQLYNYIGSSNTWMNYNHFVEVGTIALQWSKPLAPEMSLDEAMVRVD